MKAKKILLLFFSIFVVSLNSIASNKFENMKCRDVNQSTVFKALKKDFNSVQYHLPFKNFSFDWGFYSLASCWSLARLQRMYFYLGDENIQMDPIQFADLVRNSSPYQNGDGKWLEWPVQISSMLPSYPSPEWSDLLKGFLQTGEQGGEIHRNFESEVSTYQVKRFHDLGNVEYLRGEVPRTPPENAKSFQMLKSALLKNDLPLVILRPRNDLQHVVLVKSFSNSRFTVYDSNSPNLESEFYFNEQSGYFYAPQIMTGFSGVDPQRPVGLFIVDPADLNLYKKPLYQQFKNNCQ